MQNTSEQQQTDARVPDGGTTINIQPARRKQKFLFFLLCGFVVMTAIVFSGLYIDQITAALLGKPPVPLSNTSRPLTREQLDSIAATMAVPDDKALTVREGLVLWLKADALKLKNNDPIQVIPDASEKHFNALQPTKDAQPLYIENALNGKPVMRFDGADDHYLMGDLRKDTAAASIFIVWQKKTSGGAMYQRVYSSSGTAIDYQTKGAAFIPPTDSSGIGSSAPRVDALVDKALDLRNFFIGRLNANAEQFFFGDLAEILVFTRELSVEEQQAVQVYLRTKYHL